MKSTRFYAAVAALAGSAFLLPLTTASGPAGSTGGDAGKLVLAFYYPWYHTVDYSGYCTWNFGGLKYEEKDALCAENKNAPHMPTAGLYDSLDPEVIRRHLDESRKAGIDGWIVSWWGIKHDTDVLDLILSEAATHAPGFKISLYYEMIPGCRGYRCEEKTKEERTQAVLEDFRYLRDRYFSHGSFLKVSGRPVVFVYMRAMLQGGRAWPDTVEAIRREMDVFLSADVMMTFLTPVPTKGFDQVHFYNQVYELAIFSPRLVDYRGFVKRASWSGLGSAVTVIPGYDERLVPGRPGLHLNRKDGATYRIVWEKALAADPDWILITSWNEWYEGSEIEPSVESGDKYLEITAEYSAAFKGSRCGCGR